MAPSRGVSSRTWPPFGAAFFLGLRQELLGGRLTAGESHPRAADETGGEAAKAVFAMAKARGLCHPPLVEIERAADFDLERMHARLRLSIEIGGVPSGIGGVTGDGKAQLGQGALSIDDQLRRSGFTVTVPDHDVGAARCWRH